MQEFPGEVAERIGCYVYVLYDPDTNEPFYVGKGMGNRLFAHVRESIEMPKESDKLQRIRDIRAKGQEVQYEILRHGMTANEAFEVEAAIIDYIGIPTLANEVTGRDSDKRGRMGISDIIAIYAAQPIKIQEPVVLIIVNKLWGRNITPDNLYEITRGDWVMGERRNKAKYAFAVNCGVVREVYQITGWSPVEGLEARNLGAVSEILARKAKIQKRWRFEGKIAEHMQHYVSGSVADYLARGAQNPIKYVNC